MLLFSAPVGARIAPVAGPMRTTPTADSASAVTRPSVIVVDTLAARDTSLAGRVRKTAWTMQPRFVMIRSLLVPGWGQFTNHSYIKAASVAGGEVLLVARILRARRDADRFREEANAAALRHDDAGYAVAAAGYNAGLDRQVGGQWLLGGVIAYAMIDAYVDAHFRDFDIEFRTDPALPPGTPVDPPARGRGGKPGGGGMRAALRWHF